MQITPNQKHVYITISVVLQNFIHLLRRTRHSPAAPAFVNVRPGKCCYCSFLTFSFLFVLLEVFYESECWI